MKVLFLGEIVGRCGTGVIKKALKTFRKENNVDFVIANGEGATGGYGLGFANAQTIHHMGVDVFALGEKTYFKTDMVENIDKFSRALRPANYPEGAPGKGIRYYNVNDKRVCIINALGMMGFNHPHTNNPFTVAESWVSKAHSETPFVFYIFHSQATAEKQVMGYLLNGKASAVIGTHTKTQTADAQILDQGTAYISDLGRCGASNSVGGFNPEQEIKKYRTQVFIRSKESWEKPQMQGLLVTFDDVSGKAIEVQTIRQDVECTPPQE